MREGAPNQENFEGVSKKQVIDSLRINPEDLSFLQKFLDRREAEGKNSRDTLALNVEVAEIYRDANLSAEAREAFLQAALQAWQERDDALYNKLMSEAEKL